MRVIFFTTGKVFNSSKATGGTKRFLELYFGFIEKEIDVTLCSMDDSGIAQLGGKQHIQLPDTSQGRNKHIPQEFYNLKANWKILHKIKKMSYDELIVFDTPNCVGLVLAGLNNINLFIRQDLIGYKKIHYSESGTSSLVKHLNLLIFKISEVICFIRVKKIHVQCSYDYNKITNRHPFIAFQIKKKTTIQINNVNPAWIVKNSEKARKNMLPPMFDNGFFTICYVGDFSSNRKGYKLLLDVLRRLVDQGVKYNALLVGDGKNLTTCRNQFQGESNIMFTGRVENPALYLLQSDLCIVPSYEDSCPNTVLEALYNQIPVIGSRSGGIPEILVDPDWVFKPNVSDLLNMLLSMMNETYYKELEKHQRLRREQLIFEWSESVLRFLNSGKF